MNSARICRAMCVAAVAILLNLPALATEPDGRSGYQVEPRDKLMVRVGQWLDGEGTYRGWNDVTGEYSVSAEGTLSLPLIGAVAVAGKTPNEIAREITDAFEARVGLADPVATSVEVSEYRPVFVTGAVNNPGAFPWQPELTVMQAIGLAGGLEKSSSVFLSGERNALSALGDYQVYRLRLWRDLAKRARLEAELAGRDTIEMPDRLKNAPMADALIRTEAEVKKARDHALTSSLNQIESLEKLLQQQIDTMTEQIKLRDRQVQLAKQELEDVSNLMEKGLTVQSRQNQIERTVADLESRQLDLQSAKLEAQQSLNKAERDKTDLLNEHRREIVTELGDMRANIDELQARIETERGLYGEASRLGSGEFRLGGAGTPVLTVTRAGGNGGGGPVPIEETAQLRPGDVLDVQPGDLDSIPMAPAGSVNSEAHIPSLGAEGVGRAGQEPGGGDQRGAGSAARGS